MSVKVILRADGSIESIEAPSPKEVQETYVELLRNGGRTRNARANGAGNKPEASAKDDGFPEAAKKLVRTLAAFPQGMKTSDVARTLGVAPRGVGGSIMSLTNWGKHHKFAKSKLIIKERVPDGQGKMIRKIRITEEFVKLIREGKIPGFVF